LRRSSSRYTASLPSRPAHGTRRASVAIVVAHSHPNLLADLRVFWQSAATFGPGARCPDVAVHTMPGAGYDARWAQEACIDVQLVCATNADAAGNPAALAEYHEGEGFGIPTGLGSPNCARLCAELLAAP
jgi:hypothetical protein